jgi:two-component sensor histidine kinase
VSEGLLGDIVDDYLDLLESSAAIYETNGDYALGIFTSGWCRFMDQASRACCDTTDNAAALRSGQWHCHESCWNTSKTSIETDQPADLPCNGGIRIYAVPIKAGGEIVGSINFGYGEPPKDPEALEELAARYRVPVEELRKRASATQARPPFLIQLAKQRLRTSAKLLGTMLDEKRRQQREHDLAEETMRVSLREKETLLKEIHHRVKNNLAVVSSMFYLESRHAGDERTIAILEDSRRRIRSMALVHETLSGSHNLAAIDFADYARVLAGELQASYGGLDGGVTLSFDTQPVTMSLEQAMPCGLILNELISNAYKHAFRAGRRGTISIGVRLEGDGACVIDVADDGVGVPAEVDAPTHQSLGLRLVGALVRQLRATFEFVRLSPGTNARLKVPRHGNEFRP